MWRPPCCALLRNTRAARSCKPFFFARGGAVQGGLEVSFFVGRCCISDRTERQFVATFRVARLTFTNSETLVSRPTVTHVAFGLPRCEEPLKKQKMKRSACKKQTRKNGKKRKNGEKMKEEKRTKKIKKEKKQK